MPSLPALRLLLLSLVVLAFHGLFADGQQLLGWDDTSNLVTNDGFQGLDASHLAWMFQATHLAVYEPLAWLLKALEFEAFGMSARGFHLVTLAIHISSTCVVFDLSRRLVARGWSGATTGQVDTAAFFSALIFGVHPLRVEVVAWASGQSYALAGLFFLLSLAAYVRHAAGGARRWLWISFGAYVAAGLSKSASAMLPLVLLVLDVYPFRRPLTRRVVVEKLPFFFALVALVLVAAHANRDGDVGNAVDLDAGERLARAVQGVVFYVAKTLWPAGLAPVYAVERARLALLAPETLLAVFAVVMAVVVAVRRRGAWPWLGAAMASYVVVLLPVLGLVQHGVVTMAFDRYAYMSTVGLDILLGVGLAWLWARSVGRRVAVTLTGLLVGLTALQTPVWRTTEALWRHAITVTPESVLALNNLGWNLVGAERWEEAEPLFARAVALEPRDVRSALNYGVTIEHLGRMEEALGFYGRALRSLPEVPELHFNQATLLAKQGHPNEARAAYERAAALRPDWALPRERLARLSHNGGP